MENDSFIITYTGRKVYPLDLKKEDICLEDIAHALSNKCRFTGHTVKFFSVAEHSVLVAQQIRGFSQLWGLLHDAAEAYLPDIDTRIKPNFPQIIEAETNILNQVREKYGLDELTEEQKQELKDIDRQMAACEVARLMKNCPLAAKPNKEPRLAIIISGWPPPYAKERFLQFAKSFACMCFEK